MRSPFPCNSVVREWLRKKTQTEKKTLQQLIKNQSQKLLREHLWRALTFYSFEGCNEKIEHIKYPLKMN